MRKDVCLTLPGPLVDRLDAEARERHMPRSYIVQEHLEARIGVKQLAEVAASSARLDSAARGNR